MSNSSQSTRPVFFTAYTFIGQLHVFAGQVKIINHSPCRTSAILKYFCPLDCIKFSEFWWLKMLFPPNSAPGPYFRIVGKNPSSDFNLFLYISDGSKSLISRTQTSQHTGRVMSHIEPSIVEDQHKWSVFKSTVNLPAVLNDPRLLKRETDFFTKTWGVDFYERSSISPSYLLPEITRFHFEQYIKRTAAVSTQWRV